MSFGTNLQHLRKTNNLTQEQFAEKMLVSRQTVSKWEQDLSYPETEKIVTICDMFSCNMDMLLRGDCTKITDNKIDEYNSHMNFFTFCIAFATFFILFGVSLLLFMFYLGVSETVGTAVLLSCIAVSVGFYIVSGIRHDDYIKKNKDLKLCQNKQEVEKFNKKFPFLIAIPTIMILIGVVWLVVFAEFIGENERLGALFTSLFMLDIAVSVAIYIFAGMQKLKYDLEEVGNKELSEEEEKIKKKNEKYSSIIMLIATIVFFILGFAFNLWNISWIAFPIGGILCGIVSELLKK